VPTAVFYNLSTVCQYLSFYRRLVLSLCPLLSSKVSPLSVSTTHFTACWFCVTVSTAVFCSQSTAVFHSLSTVCQYLPMHRLLVLLQMISSAVPPLSVSTSYCTVCCVCVTVSTAVFYSLSTVCQYLTLYRLLVLCHFAHCCPLQSLHPLSVPHNVPVVGSVSLCQLISSAVPPLSVSTSHCTVCWFCVTLSLSPCPRVSSTVSPLSVSTSQCTVCSFCHYAHCCLLQSLHCLSVRHFVPPVDFVSLCPLVSSTVCPLSVSTSNCTVCFFLCQYIQCSLLQPVRCLSVLLTPYRLWVLIHCVHCYHLQSLDSQSIPPAVPSVGSLTLYPLLSSSVFPLSVSNSHCNVGWFCVTVSTVFFYSLSTVYQYLILYRLLVLCHYVR